MLVVKEANQEWLPEDWTVKIKRRSTGKKYKCYSDPSNQCRFYSKPEVLRYLKTMKQTSVLSNHEETCNVGDSASKVVCERSVEKDLPPGWVKELRIREGANKIRKDPYFTDPVSGYVFRSKKDVIRYIKTGQVSKRAFLPGKRHINDLEETNVKTSSLSVAKRQKQQYPATRQTSFAGMSLDICRTATLESQSSLLRGPVRTRSALSKINEKCTSSNDQAFLTPASLNNGIDKDRTGNSYGRSSKKKEIILPNRTSSRLAGNFVTPQAGKKFSSEDLIPNLKKDNSAQNELQTANTNIDGTSETTNMHVVKETNQEWLPVGWRVKIRQKSSGQKYKCYIDPSNQCRFYSKPEVLRYLKTMKQTSELSLQEEAGIVEDSASKVPCERSVDKDLPPGWIKELKTRESANKIRKDLYYTDPVSGYVFRSKKDVIRYVKTGHVSKHAFLPKKRHIDHLELAKVKTSSSPVAKKQKQQYNETRQRPFTGTSFDTWSTVTLKSQTSDLRGSVRTMSALSKINEKTEKCASKNDQAFSTPAPLNRKKERLLPSRSSRRLAGVTLQVPKVEHSATNQLLLTQTNAQAISTPVPLDNEIEKDHIGNGYGKSNKKKEIILPCRTSRRLAGVNLEGPEVENSATDELPITPTDDKAADVGRNKSIESDVEKTSCTTENFSIKSNKNKRVDLPCQSLPRINGDKSQQSKVELSETNNQENPSSGDNSVFLVHGDEKSSSRGKSNKNKGLELSLRSSKRLGGTKLELPIVESQLESPSDPETILTSAADLKGEKLTENGIRKCSSRMTTNKSAKSNKDIEKKFPSRSSERCAGLATEISGEQMLQNTVGESDIEVGPTIKLILDSLAEEASEGFRLENNVLLPDNKKSFDDEVGPNEHQVVETEKPDLLCGDPCREFSFGSLTGTIPSANVVTEMPTSGYAADQISEKSLDGEVGHDQHQVVETEKPDLLCGDPCREFSFGSLTGTIPSADVVTEMPTSGYAADQISKNTISGNFGRFREKKEINVPGWSLAQTPGFQQVDDSAPQISRSKPGEEYLDLHLSLNPSADGTRDDVPHEELSKNKEYLKNQIFGENDQLSNNKEHMKDLIFGQNELGNSNSDAQMHQPFLPSGNYWSDPCLEFAYKTLTGAIPLDDEFTISDYSQQPDTSQSEVENISAVPDFGFQSNISSHVDASGSQPTSQQVQLIPSVPPPPGTGNLPGFSAVGTQQPFVVQSDDIQGNSSSQI